MSGDGTYIFKQLCNDLDRSRNDGLASPALSRSHSPAANTKDAPTKKSDLTVTPSKQKPLSEAAIHKAVVSHWKHFGLPNTLVATVPNMGAMGQYGLTKGLPDLLILAPSLPVGFIELKSETGRVSEAQLHFQTHCERLHIPFAITRGRDEPIKLLELWGVVREAS